MDHDNLVIQRTGHEALVRMDGNNLTWVWSVPAKVPDGATVMQELDDGTVYFTMPDVSDLFMAMPMTRTLQPSTLLAMLTHDESKLLMGYCQHVADQLLTHIGYLVASMGYAVADKDWPALHALNVELAEALGAQQLAASTAREAYFALEREEVANQPSA